MADRQVWFVTRPERDPQYHKEALIALQEATNNFTCKWHSNRSIHKKYEHQLAEDGMKRNNISKDGSGGRTWAAMLRTFAYVYVDNGGFLRPTKVGRALLNGEKVRENVTKQLLTFQIPNAYFLSPNFRPKFDSQFEIRPLRFLVKLCIHDCLDGYITKEEIIFFAMPAKKDSELEKVVADIIKFRQADEITKEEMKNQIAALCEHRERIDNAARSFEENNSDVAHTFMLMADYTGFVKYERGNSPKIFVDDIKQTANMMKQYDLRYPFNRRYMISLSLMAENNGLDVDSYKASSFFDKNKKVASNNSKAYIKAMQLLKENKPVTGYSCLEEIKGVLMNEFKPSDAMKIAPLFIEEKKMSLDQDFVNSYLNQSNPLEFENQTGKVLTAIGFYVTMRPKPVTDVTTQIEIAVQNNEILGLIDAKDYGHKFVLSANLTSHMASEYIPNYDGFAGKKVSFFGYVALADVGGESNLKKITEIVKRDQPDREIKGIMINAKTLLGFLDYCIEHEINENDRVKLFLKSIDNKAYTNLESFLSAVFESKK